MKKHTRLSKRLFGAAMAAVMTGSSITGGKGRFWFQNGNSRHKLAVRIFLPEDGMRICDLKYREVINIRNCKRLGFAGDIDFDLETGCILAIIVPGPPTICGFLGREKEFIIPFGCIKQVGPDIILVDVDEKEVSGKCKA